jgi:two-component system, NarL family, sensor histidine kinase BarA
MVINSRIDLYNKKLEKDKLNKNDIKILICEIKENTKKLNNLLETFLFLSRVENKIENLEKKEFNFNEILEIYTKDYLNTNNLLDTNINIKYIFSFNKKILLNENTFKILFENLLSNAIKFTKKNYIKIEIWVEENFFWIKDNWIWINSEDLKNIWNKFFRKDNKIEGFWIGLFLVKRLSNLYDWNIKIESKKNIWTKFIINF